MIKSRAGLEFPVADVKIKKNFPKSQEVFFFLARAGLAVTVAHVVCAPSTAPPFVTSDLLSLVPKKRSALLAFFRTTHSVSSPVTKSQLFQLKQKTFPSSRKGFGIARAGLEPAASGL